MCPNHNEDKLDINTKKTTKTFIYMEIKKHISGYERFLVNKR